jgi:AI-2 transport protein TqsA
MNQSAENPLQLRDTLLKIMVVLIAFLAVDRLVAFLSVGRDLFVPFIIAVFLSILVGPILDFFDRRKFPRILSILLALGLALAFLLLVFRILYQGGEAFVEQVLKRQDRFQDLARQAAALAGLPADLVNGGENWLENPRIAKWLGDLPIGGTVGSLLTALQGLLSEILLVLLFLLFLLIGRGQLSKKIVAAFSPTVADRISLVVRSLSKDVRTYLGMKALISLAVGSLTTIVLLLFGIESALIWGILTSLLNFIPNIGSLFGMVLPVLFALVQLDSPTPAFWLFIVLLTIHFLIGSVIEPKIMGRSVDLSPVVILFALIFWSFVWGIAGMFLAVPLTVVLKIILDNINPLRPLGALMAEAKG